MKMFSKLKHHNSQQRSSETMVFFIFNPLICSNFEMKAFQMGVKPELLHFEQSEREYIFYSIPCDSLCQITHTISDVALFYRNHCLKCFTRSVAVLTPLAFSQIA